MRRRPKLNPRNQAKTWEGEQARRVTSWDSNSLPASVGDASERKLSMCRQLVLGIHVKRHGDKNPDIVLHKMQSRHCKETSKPKWVVAKALLTSRKFWRKIINVVDEEEYSQQKEMGIATDCYKSKNSCTQQAFTTTSLATSTSLPWGEVKKKKTKETKVQKSWDWESGNDPAHWKEN